MSLSRPLKKLIALALAAGAVGVAVQFGAQGAAARATGCSAQIAHDGGSPNSVPPILPRESRSQLAALEAWEAVEFLSDPGPTARYSDAEMRRTEPSTSSGPVVVDNTGLNRPPAAGNTRRRPRTVVLQSRSGGYEGPVVKFRILGPLEVVRDGEALVLGAAQQRSVLAVLVLRRGEAVPIDHLIDELWGEKAPASAAKTVQVYVSHLRKALGAEVIVTEGRGYRLAVEPRQVDVDEFESLCAEGRRALASGDAEHARERLGAALALWRGEPLADFAYDPFAQGAIAELQATRLAALEDRIDADLAAGSDGELIGELESLVASNPLRERVSGQLMLALYRAGRQADALAVYRRASELLREELGLGPSRGLQELERSILDQDASLDRVPRAPPDAAAVCPFKGLAFFDRADAKYFCGRERLVSDLLARLVESTILGILGPSGIGKSSLLHAGVLPALSAGALPGSSRWRQVLLRPGEVPGAELRRAFDGARLDVALGTLAPGERVVIAVDQLEEVFTACEDDEHRSAFLAQLALAACDPERRALVVVSLRADFYGRLASYPRFAGQLSRSHVLVGPMDRDELARAIEEPAARAGLEAERGLVDALVSEVIGEPGGLPLLSTTLLELWRARDRPVLRHESYRATGGVRGAVARMAETA